MFNVVDNEKPLSGGIRFRKCAMCGGSECPLSVEGNGRRRILVVCDRPNSVQWQMRSWFADRSYPVYQALRHFSVNPEEDTWWTGALLCGGKFKFSERYEPCLVNLDETIRKCKPRMIITSGPVATGAVLRLYNPSHFTANVTPGIYYGRCIPLNQERDWNCWLVPVYSDKMVDSYPNNDMKVVARDWVTRNIEQAVWVMDRDPDSYEKPSLDLLYSTDEILSALDQAESSDLTAFDYETNRLEPQYSDAKILTTAVAMGTTDKLVRTVAFPMNSVKVLDRWKRYLSSPVPKMGANIKYEHYWSSVFLKTPVENWRWDVGVGARIFECRPGMASLKYITFVMLGVIGYDDDVEGYMKSDEKGLNRLSEMEPSRLLTYNAYDAAYTYECSLRQSRMLGFPI